MRALEYRYSIPYYILTKLYNTLNRKKRFPLIFPALKLKKNLMEPILNGPHWVKLKPKLCGICGSDQNLLRADEAFSMEPYASFPCILGHEIVAEVMEIGSEVKNCQLGDLVIVNPAMGCKVHDREEECEYCAQGLDSLCLHFAEEDDHLGKGMSLGYHKATGGGFADFLQAHDWQIYPISKDIPLRRAVLADPLSSAMAPILDYAQGKKEEKTVIIYGAGAIGLLCVAAIKALELPWKVIVGYRYSFQGELARKLGADKIIKTGNNFYREIAKLSGAKIRPIPFDKPVMDGGVDAIFDCVGSPMSIDDSLRLVKAKGHVYMVATGHNLNKVDPTPLWFREVTFKGSCMSHDAIDPRTGEKKTTYKIIQELLSHMHIEELVTHSFALKEYKEAFNQAINKGSGNVVKVVFDLSR